MSLKDFASYLESIRTNTRARGELRRGPPLAMPHVVRHLAAEHHDVGFLVGALFAEFPGPGGRSKPLPTAYREWVQTLPESTREQHLRRWSGLLDAPADRLRDHLRHALGLMHQHRRQVDWGALLDDVARWDDETRRRWAQEFYAPLH